MSTPVEGRHRTGNGTPWLDASLFVVVCAALLAIGSVTSVASGTIIQPLVAGLFCCLIALGELIRLRLTDDRVQAPLGLAGSLGYVLLSDLPGDQPMLHSIPQTVAVVTVGMLVGMVPHLIAGRPPELVGMSRRVLVLGIVTAVYRPFVLDPEIGEWMDRHAWAHIGLVVAIAALAWFLEAAVNAGVRAPAAYAPFRALLRNEVKAWLGIGAAISSTGVVMALAASEVGLWALPVFSVPLIVAQISYRRYSGIRHTQMQTIRALSRATEVGGYTETGHSRRVASLARSVGQRLGLTDERLRELESAALMHDLGQLSLADPIPGGATVLQGHQERRELAAAGAEIIREAGVPGNIAAIVEAVPEPYRRPHVPDDHEVPLESRIIKVATDYDDLTGESKQENARVEALERLRLGMAYEYDPKVVSALARILERDDLTVA